MPNDNQENTNLKFYRGDTAIKRFRGKDKTGTKYNLNGFEIKAQARPSPDSETKYFDITIVDGQNGSDFANGIVVLRVPANTVASMPPQCLYDIQATSGSLTVTIAKGRINTTPDITR